MTPTPEANNLHLTQYAFTATFDGMEPTARVDGRMLRSRATRAALRRAALELAGQRGVDEIRVEEIAVRAGVSTRTFFNHFPVKEDALLMDLFAVPERQLAEFAAAEPSDPAGTWAGLTELFAADVDRAGAEVPRYLPLQGGHPGLRARQLGEFARFESRLADAIATRVARAGTDRLVADVMSGSCLTAVRVGLQQWGRTGWAGPPRRHVEAAFAVLAGSFP